MRIYAPWAADYVQGDKKAYEVENMQEERSITVEELDRFADHLHDMAAAITAEIEEGADLNMELIAEIRGENNPDLTAIVVDSTVGAKMREGEDVSDTLARLIERAYNSADALVDLAKRLHAESEHLKLKELN
jgi:hypothetical protein